MILGGTFFKAYGFAIILAFAVLVALGLLTALTVISSRSKKNIEKLYNFDELTGIYNKNGFFKYANSFLHSNFEYQYCIASLDIYRFKILNEILGRDFGDKILKEIARCLKEDFGENGVFCRYGSDIFALCIPYNTVSIEKLQKINDKLEKKFDTGGDIVLSVGVYLIDKPDMSVAAMFDRAYMAAKSIKGSYITRFAMYDDRLRESLLEERELTFHMKEALENGEFQVYLQPKYSLDTEKITGSEALIRWSHPTKGMISPAKFIPIFERNGLILTLDLFVLETVCKVLFRWKEEGKKLFPISVNLSRRNILQNHIAETVRDVVNGYGLEPALVNIEITETAYIDNPELLNRVIDKLRSFGFVICIDDFGSGYSSLNTLKDVPADVLKIDLKFLMNFEKDSKGASILSSILRMAKSLDMTVVAEGVETKEQASFLRSLGCNAAQGYFYCKPITVDRFEEIVQKQEKYHCVSEERDFISERDIENFWENDADMNVFLRNILGGFGIYEIKDGVILASRVNDGYFDLVGCPREIYYKSDRTVLDWIYPVDRSKVTSAFLKTMETHKPEDVVYRRMTPQGKIIWLRSKFCFIAGNDFHSLYYAYFTDITNQIQTENELRSNEIRYRIIMDYMQDMIFEWDKKTDDITVCDKFCAKFGYQEKVFSKFSKNFFKSNLVAEEDKEKVQSAFYSVYYGEKESDVFCRINYFGKKESCTCRIIFIRMQDVSEDELKIIGIINVA